jgi:hypothetical protein
MRNSMNTQMFGANAQAAVPSAYNSIVSIIVRTRPMRSHTTPKSTPPIAQPMSNIAVSKPVQYGVAALASCDPNSKPSSTGTAFGAT